MISSGENEAGRTSFSYSPAADDRDEIDRGHSTRRSFRMVISGGSAANKFHRCQGSRHDGRRSRHVGSGASGCNIQS
jgi:hypothetical protein